MEKRPYIICHMVQSLDGRIDCHMVDHICGSEYDEIRKAYKAPSFVNGRVTIEKYWATGRFKAVGKTRAMLARGQECPLPCFVATKAQAYAVCVDTKGVLTYKNNLVEDMPLVVVTSAQATKEYLSYLASKSISYIVAGKKEVNLKKAMEILGGKFGVKKLLLMGGGLMNGAFLKAGLIDEYSIIIGAGIDGRMGRVASFDGLKDINRKPYPLKLKAVRKYKNGSVWLKYVK